MNKLGLAIMMLFAVISSVFHTKAAQADEFTVYEVFRPVDLGETERQPPKDIFINMGANHGVKKGSILDVYRKVLSFDNVAQKLAGEHMIPVGRIKVIHADDKTAIARVDKFVSIDQEPAELPQAIMIGDVVKPASKSE